MILMRPCRRMSSLRLRGDNAVAPCVPHDFMKIHILSDLHLECGPYTLPSDLDCDVVVAAGDIGEDLLGIEWLRTLSKPVLYVAGNHEFYRLHCRDQKDMADCLADVRVAAAGTNVTVLQNEAAVIDGIRFLGTTLWTNYGNLHPSLLYCAGEVMTDHRCIHARRWFAVPENQHQYRELYRKVYEGKVDLYQQFHGENLESKLVSMWPKYERQAEFEIERGMFTPIVAYNFHVQALAWLTSQLETPFAGKTVVVTHHHPSYESLIHARVDDTILVNRTFWPGLAEYSVDLVKIASYASDLDALLEKYRNVISLWVAGHLHVKLDYVRNGVRVVSNPRGQVSAWNLFQGDGEGFDPRFAAELAR